MRVFKEAKDLVRAELQSVLLDVNFYDRTKRVIEDIPGGRFIVINMSSSSFEEDSASQLRTDTELELSLYAIGLSDSEFDDFTQQVFDAMPPRNLLRDRDIGEWIRLRRYSTEIDYDKFGKDVLGCVLSFECRFNIDDTKPFVTTDAPSIGTIISQNNDTLPSEVTLN